jgi:hypothetical protein
MYQNGTGIGINTTNPQATLHISNNGTTLNGTAMSNTVRSYAGQLGTNANDDLMVASFGFGSANNSALGIRAYRTANGADWFTTAIGLEMDVDNTKAAGAGIWLNANSNVGIGTITPTEKLEVVGNVRFSGALMPNNLPGNTGDILTSQGAGVAPIWKTPGSIIKASGVNSTRTTINSSTYTDITGLVQTVTLSQASIVFISAWGALETFSTSSSGGSGTRTSVINTTTNTRLAEETVDVNNTSGFTQVVLPFSINTFQSLPAGTYTFKVQSQKYIGSNFYAGGSSTSLANEGSMTILIIPQ